MKLQNIYLAGQEGFKFKSDKDKNIELLISLNYQNKKVLNKKKNDKKKK